MTEPHGDDDRRSESDQTETVSAPGGESPDPEFGDDATIPDQET